MTTTIEHHSTGTVPERSLQQRRDALATANAIRTHRKELKRDLKGGRRSPAAILRGPHPEVETMTVFDLLLATPKVGRVKANAYLKRCRISPSKTLAGLTERQRGELLAVMPAGR